MGGKTSAHKFEPDKPHWIERAQKMGMLTVQVEVIHTVGEETFEKLREEWCRVKNQSPEEINWNKTSVTINEFRKLHEGKEMEEKELEGLFNLYDYSHSGAVSWGEFACIIALILQGSVNEKIHCVFCHREL